MSRQDRIEPLSSAAQSPAALAPQASSDQAGKAAAPVAKSGRKKRALAGVAGLVVLTAGYYGQHWWTEGRFMIETDDAYVQADLSLISAKLSGYVADIAVAANQHVQKGDLLFRIDDGDFLIAKAQAEARLAGLNSTLARVDAQIAAAQSTVVQAEAQLVASEAVLTAAQSSAKRVEGLASRRVASQADLDSATEGLATAQANRAAAAAAINGAKAQIEVLKAQRVEALSTQAELSLAVDQAKRNLDFTQLRAPFEGTIANIAIKEGELVTAGARLAAVIPVHGLYIEANLKETQLAEVHLGQKVRVTIDALEGHQIEGEVSSIAPATGAVFSLLPAENATGNFTKIVQRVPVRIALPDGTPGLRAGLSAIVAIDQRTAPSHDTAEGVPEGVTEGTAENKAGPSAELAGLAVK